jgi:hypothetical protein
MKKLFELVARLARGKGVWVISIGGLLSAASAQGSGYTVQFGQQGAAPFADDPPSSSYGVDPTGIQNQQGVHGFVVHHNGTDTYVDMPGENYYIGGLHINNSGEVCGTYNANYGGYGDTSFFWVNGALTLLPSSGGFSDPHISDMNDFGVTVGTIDQYTARQGFILDHGVLSLFSLSQYAPTFDYGGTSYNVAGSFATIDGINDLGQLYGNVMLTDREIFWYVASPIGVVPEPSTMTLLGLGAFALVKLRKKSRLG